MCNIRVNEQVLHALPPTSAAVPHKYLQDQLCKTVNPTRNLGPFFFDKICVFIDVLRPLPQGRRYAAHIYMRILGGCGLKRCDWEVLQTLDSALREIFADSCDIRAETASKLDRPLLDLPTGVREIRAAHRPCMFIPGELTWSARHEVPDVFEHV